MRKSRTLEQRNTVRFLQAPVSAEIPPLTAVDAMLTL
jgi:hypothetical protein